MKKLLMIAIAVAALAAPAYAAPKGAVSNTPSKWTTGWNVKQCASFQLLSGVGIFLFNTDGTQLQLLGSPDYWFTSAVAACEKGTYYAQVNNPNLPTPQATGIFFDH